MERFYANCSLGGVFHRITLRISHMPVFAHRPSWRDQMQAFFSIHAEQLL